MGTEKDFGILIWRIIFSVKKIIFTNGSNALAANVTEKIGIDKLFDGVFDIVDSDFYPKPSMEPYKKIIENYNIEPEYCIFFEDIARNLKPAHRTKPEAFRLKTVSTQGRADVIKLDDFKLKTTIDVI